MLQNILSNPEGYAIAAAIGGPAWAYVIYVGRKLYKALAV